MIGSYLAEVHTMGAMKSFVIMVTLLLGLSVATYTEAQSVRPAVFVTNNALYCSAHLLPTVNEG